MKNINKTFRFLFIVTLLSMFVGFLCFSGMAGSFPGYVGMVFPACCLSVPLFFHSISIKRKTKSNIEFYIASSIIIFQIILLFI